MAFRWRGHRGVWTCSKCGKFLAEGEKAPSHAFTWDHEEFCSVICRREFIDNFLRRQREYKRSVKHDEESSDL